MSRDVKYWLGLFATLAGITVLVLAAYVWFGPGHFERQFSRVHVGMTKAALIDCLGKPGDYSDGTVKLPPQFGRGAWRWVYIEKNKALIIDVAFDADGAVHKKNLRKYSYHPDD
jgi:hypothetical protein